MVMFGVEEAGHGRHPHTHIRSGGWWKGKPMAVDVAEIDYCVPYFIR